MLRDALGEALKGKHVVVLTSGVGGVYSLMQMLNNIAARQNVQIDTNLTQWTVRVRGEGHGSIRFKFIKDRDVDPVRGRVAGFSGPVFADHYAIETWMGWALREWLHYSVDSRVQVSRTDEP